jgi:16S rRNA (adenine1518-N6/adenine1519-N6)-dimethyltransferase
MSRADGLPPLREVVETYDLAAKKSLGQNFLFDLNLTGRIARACGPLDGVTIIEVGPGPGGLTRALLSEGASQLIAVERDERCLPALAEIESAYAGRLKIVHGDALATDWRALVADVQGPVRICANLPYNIGTALLVGWLESDPWPPWYERMVLMFQREVAERIVATPAERVDYGRLGVLAGWRTKARILFDVPPSAFTPPPKVTSSIVELTPRETLLDCNGKILTAVTASAFNQRRKMLRQSLKGLAVNGKTIDALALLHSAGITETKRAEEIDVAGFVTLARIAEEMSA